MMEAEFREEHGSKILPPSVLADTVGRRTIRTHVLVRQLETIKLEMRKELSYKNKFHFLELCLSFRKNLQGVSEQKVL